MADKEKKMPLFGDFEPVSEKTWEELAVKDLKGIENFRKLTWKTPDGYSVNPYYTRDSAKGKGFADTLPGRYPFVRGKKTDNNNWHIRQNIRIEGISESNKKALEILMKGIDSLGFILKTGAKFTKADLEKLCENIYAEAVELNFINFSEPKILVNDFIELLKKYNRHPGKIFGSVDYDPLGELFLKKDTDADPDDLIDTGKELILATKHLPGFRVLSVNCKYFHNSGGGMVEELAFSLAQGTNYLTRLTDRGLTVCEVAPKILFNFATGSSYFREIAKLRAARLLWSAVVKAYGPSSTDAAVMNIHCESSLWDKTVYDPYVNLLRTTSETMSAIIGGADSVTVTPFNVAYGQENASAERLARNQQLLLREESYFDKVADPAGGSWYIETLTDLVAEESWKLFLEVHENGGFTEALKNGFIHGRINETAQRKIRAIATRREVLLGTNQYPDFREKLDYEKLEKIQQSGSKERRRGAEEFEDLRMKTDKWALKNKRPMVFTLPLGNLAMRRARSQFACNFFACAGFEVIDNTGFPDAETASKACLESKADIAVICSSDDEYSKFAPELSELLKDKTLLVIAGNPDLLPNEAKPEAISHFIHIRSNVLESLSGYQAELGIK